MYPTSFHYDLLRTKERNYLEKGKCNVRKASKLWLDNLTNVAFGLKFGIHLNILQKVLYSSYLERTEKEVSTGTSQTENTYFKHKMLGFAPFESLVEVSVLIIPRLYTQSPIVVQ
jgi:hypothetical protein